MMKTIRLIEKAAWYAIIPVHLIWFAMGFGYGRINWGEGEEGLRNLALYDGATGLIGLTANIVFVIVLISALVHIIRSGPLFGNRPSSDNHPQEL